MMNINIIKHYQQTTGLIQRLINISHLLSIGVIVAEKFCLRKCVCCSQVSFAWKTFLFQTEKGNRVRYRQIWQGNCVEDVRLLYSDASYPHIYMLHILCCMIHILGTFLASYDGSYYANEYSGQMWHKVT